MDSFFSQLVFNTDSPSHKEIEPSLYSYISVCLFVPFSVSLILSIAHPHPFSDTQILNLKKENTIPLYASKNAYY